MRRAYGASLLAASVLLAVLPSSGASASDTPPPRKIVTGWAPYWATKASSATIVANADLMSEVTPFWFSVKSSSQILDQYTPSNSIPMATQVSALHAAGVQVVPTFTDGTAKLVLAGILADPVQSGTLVATLTALTVQNSFDGIDLDWEGFAFVDGSASWPTTQPNWTRFVAQLAASLHLQGKTLSITTPELRDPATGKRGYWVYDWAGIANSIDRLRIMTYDYSVSTAGPIGPITWVEAAAKYAVSLVPASKIFIGVPAYGRDWVVGLSGVCPVLGADGKPLGVVIRAPSNGSAGSYAEFVTNYAATLAASYGATPTWNATYGENTFTYTKTYVGTNAAGVPTSCTAKRTAWYQDPKGVLLRAALVGKYRLGGIAIWALGSEDPATWDQLRGYARTIAPDQVIGTLALSQNSVGYSTPTILSATFRVADSSPVVGAPILFQTSNGIDPNWRDIGTATTSSNGTAQLALIGSQNLQVRAVSPGTWERLPATSPPQQLKVSRVISTQPPTSIRRTSLLSVTGSVWPAEVGVALMLQMQTHGQWKNIATSTSGAGGTYVVAASGQSSGLLTYRVVAAADAKFDQTASAPFTVIIR